MAAPTPVTKVFWDGTRGAARLYAAWTAGAPNDLLNSVIVDVSALAPIPSRNAVKVRSVIVTLNGDFQSTLEFAGRASGNVNTATAGNTVTWVSGDRFNSAWLTEGFGGIHIGSTEYTLATIPTATSATLTGDPGDQTNVAYVLDEVIDEFDGQANETFEFERDYSDGPNGGITPDQSSSNFIGDITVSTYGAADGDELAIFLIFEK